MIASAKAISSTRGFDRADRTHRGRLTLTLLQAMLVLVMVTVLVIAPHLQQPLGDVVSYAARALALLAGGIAALLHSRLAEERMKLRWVLLGVWQCASALSYFIASANNFAAVFHVLDPLMDVAGTTGTAAILLSITVSFAGAPAGIVVLDLAQTGLFIALSYVVNTGANPWAKDVQSHVIISLLFAMMFFLTAALAPLSAATRDERRFFRIVATWLGAAWVGRFISSQVGYLWMHDRGTLYDLPSIGVSLAATLFLMQSAWQTSQRPRPGRELVMRNLTLRNLMPSLLAFASLLLALYVFLHVQLAGLLAVLCAVFLYLSRTLLLQTHVSHESSALRERNEQLLAITQRDPLTGAGNRRSLAACHERYRSESQACVTVLLIDLDFFKQANDRLGHLQGDCILLEVADVLRSASALVAGSHVARFGGDEFAMLLPHVDATGAAQLAETIRFEVEALTLDAGDCSISVSIGGVAAHAAEPLHELIRRADIALYRAKSRGRNRAEFELEEPTFVEDSPDLTFVSAA